MGLQHWRRSFYGKYLKITRPRRWKLRLVLEMRHVLVLGVTSWCWEWRGVGSELKLGVGSEGVTPRQHVFHNKHPTCCVDDCLHERLMCVMTKTHFNSPHVLWNIRLGHQRYLRRVPLTCLKFNFEVDVASLRRWAENRPHRRWDAFRAKNQPRAYTPLISLPSSLACSSSLCLYLVFLPSLRCSRYFSAVFASLFPTAVFNFPQCGSFTTIFQLKTEIYGNIYIYIYIYTLYIYRVWYTHIFGYRITIGNLLVHHRFGIVFRWKMDKTVIITIRISGYKPQNSCQ